MYFPTSLDECFEALPEVQACKGIRQGPFHDKDVYLHSIDFVRWAKQFTDDRDIHAAGYLHDIGKDTTKKPLLTETGEPIYCNSDPKLPCYSFPGHEEVGAGMVLGMNKETFDQFGLNQLRISFLVGAHYLPMKFIKLMREQKTFATFENQFDVLVSRLYYLEESTKLEGAGVSKRDIATMFKADKSAQGKACTDRLELFTIMNLLLEDKSLEAGTTLWDVYAMQQDIYHSNPSILKPET
jgi:hypothetical protein